MTETSPETSPKTNETPVSVSEAARILGITEDGVRKNLRRGKLFGVKAHGGSWQVYLPPQDTTETHPETNKTTTETSIETNETSGLLMLVDQLRSENTYLREELHNTHILVAQITERIPSLATQTTPATTTPVTHQEAPGQTEAPHHVKRRLRIHWKRPGFREFLLLFALVLLLPLLIIAMTSNDWAFASGAASFIAVIVAILALAPEDK